MGYLQCTFRLAHRTYFYRNSMGIFRLSNLGRNLIVFLHLLVTRLKTRRKLCLLQFRTITCLCCRKILLLTYTDTLIYKLPDSTDTQTGPLTATSNLDSCTCTRTRYANRTCQVGTRLHKISLMRGGRQNAAPACVPQRPLDTKEVYQRTPWVQTHYRLPMFYGFPPVSGRTSRCHQKF